MRQSTRSRLGACSMIVVFYVLLNEVIKFVQSQPSMKQREVPRSFYSGFKVLHVSAQNSSLQSLGVPPSRQGYELVQHNGKSIRHYLQYSQNIDAYLQVAEWRFQACPEVARCLYIKLNKPQPEDDGIEFQLFTEHMALLLKEVKKLITSEALYILISSLKGYKRLMEKFKKVSVSSQSIGLDSQGQCIVWLNRHLERHYSQYYSIVDETQLIKTVVSLLKEKGQTACQIVLNKINDFANKKKANINQTISFIENISQANFIRLPKNLKYLLQQNRIVQELTQLEGQKTARFKNRKCSTELCSTNGTTFKDNHFFISKVAKKRQEPSFFTKFVQNSQRGTKRMSYRESRLTSSKALESSNPLIRVHNASQDRQSIDKKQFSSSHRFNSKDSGSFTKSNSSKKNINVLNKMIKTTQPRSTEKYLCPEYNSRAMTKTSQAHTSTSYGEIQKNWSHKTLISRKWDSRPVTTHNSILSHLSNSAAEEEVVQQEDYESEISSPEKPDLIALFGSKDSQKSKLKGSARGLQHSFGARGGNTNKGNKGTEGSNATYDIKGVKRTDSYNIDEAQEVIFRGNNWTKTVQGLLQIEHNINNSIVEGTEKNIYLQDVQLQKLDKLKRDMAESLMHSRELVKQDSKNSRA